jgi:hypothetical protein
LIPSVIFGSILEMYLVTSLLAHGTNAAGPPPITLNAPLSVKFLEARIQKSHTEQYWEKR